MLTKYIPKKLLTLLRKYIPKKLLAITFLVFRAVESRFQPLGYNPSRATPFASLRPLCVRFRGILTQTITPDSH